MTDEAIETLVEETTEVTEEETITCEELTQEMRNQLQRLEDVGRQYIQDLYEGKVHEEIIAQAILAMRHIEDARMRYGKVLQYLWDGVSIYDQK